MGVNSMKVGTKLFNEDFIEVANNLPKMQNRRKNNVSEVKAHRAKSEHATSTTKKSKTSKTTSQSMDPDEEDRRLDRLQKMRN
jgi:hypothetical protein